MSAIVQILKSYFILMLLLLVLTHLAPKESYRQFFRFFIGLWMCVIRLRPVAGWIADKSSIKLPELSALSRAIEETPEWDGGEVNLFELFDMDAKER